MKQAFIYTNVELLYKESDMITFNQGNIVCTMAPFCWILSGYDPNCRQLIAQRIYTCHYEHKLLE